MSKEGRQLLGIPPSPYHGKKMVLKSVGGHPITKYVSKNVSQGKNGWPTEPVDYGSRKIQSGDL